ncbi:GTPase-activating protein gyp10 [Beauveria bassiana D1-5]|uniref:GTPase-activating protein gyp10 n=1 Tax=Beauveria bassiana D1-5 TaxID=1245745 RepID=A0A0A2VSM8_BEABA|nr:GTPase-activating protein gyp10 [Beauveria bassiana D1-5]
MDQDSSDEERTASAHHHPEKEAEVDRQKQDAICAACHDADVSALQRLAESEGGFLTDSLRQLAWPVLLGLPAPRIDAAQDEPLPESEHLVDGGSDSWKELPRHRDEDQVQLDVNRSFVYYPHGNIPAATKPTARPLCFAGLLTVLRADLSDCDLECRRSQLSALISHVLRVHPYLCYFQGYHDICQVLLLVLGPARAAPCVARLSVLRIRDFMLPNLGPTTAQLRLLPDVLAAADPALRAHVATVEPFYALAGTLTMYAHNIEAYRDIARLFDALLAREPVFSLYVFAQIVIDRRDEILAIDEPDLLQVVLARVPSAGMDIDRLVARAAELFRRYPPETLPAWRRISRASALKTARDATHAAKQTLAEGADLFDKQAKELRWLDLRNSALSVAWAYRRPAKALGMAMAVGLVAFYMRRNPALLTTVMSLFSK